MAKYIKKEIVDLNSDGNKTKAYYRMKTTERVDFAEFAKQCSASHRLYSPGVIQGVLMAVSNELAYRLANGCSVKIDGLGTFKAKIGISKFSDKEMDDFEEGTTKRNAMSLGVTGVGYKADKELVRAVNGNCKLERGGEDRLCKSKYTKEERIERAIKYLRKAGFMHVRDYAALNGLSYTTAYHELNHGLVGSATITSRGRKSARIYFLAPETDNSETLN